MTTHQSQQDPDEDTDKLRIVITSGRHTGAELIVELPLQKNLLIGSHSDCDLVISDEGVLSAHAIIFKKNNFLWIVGLPGSGALLVDTNDASDRPRRLKRGMVLKLGSVALLRVESNSLPLPKTPQAQLAKESRGRPLRQRRRAKIFASVACVVCSAVLMVFSLGVNNPVAALAVSAESEMPHENGKKSIERAGTAALEKSAQQINRYLADPGIQVTARFPNRIEVSGTARSAATQGQLEKVQKALPAGVEIFSTVSYPINKVVAATPAPQGQQMSKLAKKILQVAASDRSPYVEIEGGARIFEGGKLNGYEIVKITSGVIVARRDNQIETFKVE